MLTHSLSVFSILTIVLHSFQSFELEAIVLSGVYSNVDHYPLNEDPLRIQLKDDDMQLVREMLPDCSSYDDKDQQSESNEVLKQAINTEFSSLAHNLALDDEIHFETKMETIKRVLEEVFLKTAGMVDREYIDRTLEMIREAVEEQQQHRKELEISNVEISSC